ncbi:MULTISPECIES: hypothetical protein [unclassified Mesorhizobium]|uniref:hypothetical protein n=1 Tax=unclassified Mesorhizobium TaxID=325217 RepID=UPI00241810D9|nr:MULTISPECIES: hypothetical protein [unclassified Mesorhizobium]WFP63499.1 hypothetical protein QAZ47_02630 [Mesorhizobium sp. WSM4904]WFP76767.1 hypothetical protein QAZ22_02625 [Mesorhizobium sp. WSM4906]
MKESINLMDSFISIPSLLGQFPDTGIFERLPFVLVQDFPFISVKSAQAPGIG